MSINSFNLRNNNFDLIRLLAAMQVVIKHTIAHLELDINIPLINYFPGVPIFFFVSGFLISLSYEKSSNNKVYFQNRVLRIYPALFICFIVSVLSVILSGYTLLFDFNFVKWAMAQLSFLQFYNPDFLRAYGVGTLNGSLWTISVELAFYIVLPLIYFMGKKTSHMNIILFVCVTLSIMIDFYLSQYLDLYGEKIWFKLIGVSLLPYLWMFLIGVLFQRYWDVVESIVSGKLYLWSVIFLVTIALTPYVEFLGSSNHPTLLFFLILVVFISALAIHADGKWSKPLMGNDISYGVYIYHMVVVNFMLSIGWYGDKYHLFIVLGVTLLLAFLSWKLIEKPSLYLKSKTIHRV